MIEIPHPREEREDSIRHRTPRDGDFAVIAELFRLLGDPTRLKIFWLMSQGEKCVYELSETLDMTSPAISHHIRQLKSRELIDGRKEGKEVYYGTLPNPIVRQLKKCIQTLIDLSG